MSACCCLLSAPWIRSADHCRCNCFRGSIGHIYLHTQVSTRYARGVRPLPGLSLEEMEAWLGFLKAHAEVTALLDRELLDAHGTSLAGYEVLAFLSRAEGRRLRMSDLAGAVLISPGAVTRRVQALEARGLVTRSRSTGDA